MLGKCAVTLLLCIAIPTCLPAAGRSWTDEQASPYSCQAEQIPTSWAFDNPPGRIERNEIVFGELGRATLDFQFRNLESAPISALALVVEYADKTGQIIDRVPIASVSEHSTNPFSLPFAVQGAMRWKGALSPGESALMGGVTDGIRTGSCPNRARITFARAQFADGNVRSFSFPGWQIGPVPRLVPRLSQNVPSLPVDSPVSLLAKIKVSSSGQVVDVVSDSQENAKVLAWIRDRMRHWSFHPALLNGQPVDSDLTVLFLIHAKGMLRFPEIEPLLTPVTIVQFFWSHDIFPNEGDIDRWTVTYGLLQEGSIVE